PLCLSLRRIWGPDSSSCEDKTGTNVRFTGILFSSFRPTTPAVTRRCGRMWRNARLDREPPVYHIETALSRWGSQIEILRNRPFLWAEPHQGQVVAVRASCESQ